MKKIFLYIVLIFCLTNTVYSQKPKKIYNYIQNNEINLAIEELAKFNPEKKYKNEELILFDISRCLLMIEFKSNNYNPILANNKFNNIIIPIELQNQIFNFLKDYNYEFKEISNNIYSEILLNSKRINTIDSYKSSLIELRKSLNNDLINQGKRLIDNKIFQDIKSQKSIDLVIQYINQYSNSLVLQEAINYRDSLVLSVTPKSYESLLDYVNTYPNSVYSNEIKIDLTKIKYYEINLKKLKKNNDEQCDLDIRNIDKLLGKIEVIQDSVWIIDTLGNLKVYPKYNNPHEEYTYLRNESYIVDIDGSEDRLVRGVINVSENVPDSILIIPAIYSMIYSHNDLFIVSLNKGGENYKKGVYKVIRGKAKLIIPVKYEEISMYSNLLIVQLNGKKGLIDLNGNLLTEINYDEIGTYGECFNCLGTKTNIIEVLKNGKKGLIDSTGKLITPLIYDEITSFSEGLSGVRVKDKWGFINEKGNIVVPIQFYSPHVNIENNLSFLRDIDIFNFQNGLCIVQNNNKFGLINKYGKLIFPCKLDYVKIFANGNSLINLNGKSGLINNKGDVIIPVIYDGLFVEEGLVEFENKTLIVASLNKKRGVLNEFGKIIIPFIYESISIDGKGYYIVGNNRKVGLLNKFGKVITPIKYDLIHDFNFLKLAEVRINGKNGLLNEFGVQITDVIYDELWFGSDSIIQVEINRKKGLIDLHGNKITEIIYDNFQKYKNNSHSFLRGICIVSLNDKKGLINKFGKEVTDLKYSSIDYITNNIIRLTIKTGTKNDDYKQGIIDISGKEISDLKYSRMNYITNNIIRVTIKTGANNDDYKKGLIDTSGKEIIPLIYQEIDYGGFLCNLIQVRLNNKVGLIDFSYIFSEYILSLSLS